MQWWVYVDGEVKNKSFSREELNRLPEFEPDLYVMRTSEDDWVKAKDDPKLAPLFEEQRTSEPEKDSADTAEESQDEPHKWKVLFDQGQPEGPFTLHELLDISSLEATTLVKREDDTDWQRAIQDPKLRPHFSFEPILDRDGITGWLKSIPEFVRDAFWSTSDFYDSLDPRASVLYSFFFGAFGLGLTAFFYAFNQNLLLVSSLNDIVQTLGLYSILGPAYLVAGIVPAFIGLLLYTACFELTAQALCSMFDWSKESWKATAKIVSYGHGAVATYFGIFSTLFVGLIVLGKLTFASVGFSPPIAVSSWFSTIFYGSLILGLGLSTWMCYIGFRKLHNLSSRQAMAVVVLPPAISLTAGFFLVSYVTFSIF